MNCATHTMRIATVPTRVAMFAAWCLVASQAELVIAVGIETSYQPSVSPVRRWRNVCTIGTVVIPWFLDGCSSAMVGFLVCLSRERVKWCALLDVTNAVTSDRHELTNSARCESTIAFFFPFAAELCSGVRCTSIRREGFSKTYSEITDQY